MITELSSIKNNRIINCFSNVRFLEDSIVLYIDSEKFQELFLSKNILTEELIEVILKKNYQLHHIVNRELVFDATAKVAFMLIDDLKMFNKLKRVDISFMLNIQPETLSRVLKSLMRKGIINIKKGEIVIENKEDLISILNKVGDTKYN
ncbi:helix-turn-helix domain-containing protein [Aliarcobacter butzleri]|uniref:Helix-turn-helix domain-containing protein n=2 Tax=Aliarcobacter butzleri TaxID=28197 RepID=A0AAP4Q0M7_9BACT|nr:helix-turn-helix domain-containing protein [Aliarcobacter butzleri]MDN5053120.1 helix-turn-helix domain-containing protein [Aliarcobacter butzleri]MDN5076274.1 helix-turn-helix domain-containing protein [Aliarcobacter butzleri]MDN5117545.1 helix-turn-helix domain-containing protein [Aliarcobacter butzleri]MDN5133367.1 helix-turn-helix domain-containing protein [Aliarcobacter butzleri]